MGWLVMGGSVRIYLYNYTHATRKQNKDAHRSSASLSAAPTQGRRAPLRGSAPKFPCGAWRRSCLYRCICMGCWRRFVGQGIDRWVCGWLGDPSSNASTQTRTAQGSTSNPAGADRPHRTHTPRPPRHPPPPPETAAAGRPARPRPPTTPTHPTPPPSAAPAARRRVARSVCRPSRLWRPHRPHRRYCCCCCRFVDRRWSGPGALPAAGAAGGGTYIKCRYGVDGSEVKENG